MARSVNLQGEKDEKRDTSAEGNDNMKLLEASSTPANSANKTSYRGLSLAELIKKIVEESNRLALEEFHSNRTIFNYKGKPPLLFIDYLNELRESTARRVWIAPNALEVADRAYDLTVDEFSNLPDETESPLEAKNKNIPGMNPKGPDCRYSFRAFLNYIAQSFKTEPPANEIEEEARAAMAMQGLVRLHFYRSLLEAKRKINPFWSRYNWKVRGGTICVWLPKSLKGRERREWLEKNIDDPVPLRPGERERIQAIIYQKLVGERFVPFSEDTDVPAEEQSSAWSDSGETFGVSLAEAVAEEKARNIQQLRPSISALGEKKLKRLVLRIFEDMSSGVYEDGKVARAFGLSTSTFSRFAGSRWLQTGSAIPALWLNTAEILSTNPIFKEVAMSTGVWKEVQNTLERGTLRCGEEISDDQ